MTGKKEVFQPILKSRVNLFVCGPTVYDNSHIGHARTYIAFDVVARYLKFKGYSVFYLQNITDVDDKIIERAAQTNASPKALARKFEDQYLDDMRALRVCNVSFHARASDYIPEIIKQIGVLIEKGFAYETQTGIYFDESRFTDFGKLSHQTADELKEHRIEPDQTKKNQGDFSLWKKRDDGDEVTWDSPWGRGRPGWHIEDTAIADTYFGPQYDIHGGALDLIFPHHEAEIAQGEAYSGKKPFVRIWMHTGFLYVGSQKMSKSLGNFITIQDMLKHYDCDSFRLFILLAHYKSPIDYSEEALHQAKKSMERVRQLTAKIDEKILESIDKTNDERIVERSGGKGDDKIDGKIKKGSVMPVSGDADNIAVESGIAEPDVTRLSIINQAAVNQAVVGPTVTDPTVTDPTVTDPTVTDPTVTDPMISEARRRFFEAMDNDFNTPHALGAVYDLVRDVNRRMNDGSISSDALLEVRELIEQFGDILGLNFFGVKGKAEKGSDPESQKLLQILLDLRQKLRAKKDWELADEIRSRLLEMNVLVEDA